VEKEIVIENFKDYSTIVEYEDGKKEVYPGEIKINTLGCLV